MIGDKLVITDFHRASGKKIFEACIARVEKSGGIFAITVAGESGSGKSETAAVASEEFRKRGFSVLILCQDDYFILPPKQNSNKRASDISWVGMGEVRLELMDGHLDAAKKGEKSITKPLVHFEEDRIGEETLSLEGVSVVVAEGTYTTSLKKADFRAFIDKTYHDTLEHRKKRARDESEGEFIERVLEIEHGIISSHKTMADIVLK